VRWKHVHRNPQSSALQQAKKAKALAKAKKARDKAAAKERRKAERQLIKAENRKVGGRCLRILR
jgi:hypothetical protein